MSSDPHHDPTSSEGLREVVTMAWPIMLGAVSFAIMDFVDKVFVSQLGIDHLAAVGSAGIWSYTLGVIFLGIASCVSTFAAQSLGRGNRENCSRYAWQGIYIAFIGGSVALIMWPMADLLFGSMNHSPEVTELEITYFRIRVLGFVFIAWQAALSAFFQAVNRPIVTMYVSLVANIANVVLDYLLIFGALGFPRMGIAGAAIATVISLFLQVVLLQSAFLSNGVNREYYSRSTWRFDRTKTRDLVRIGWPAGVTSFLDVAGWSIFTSYIVGGYGTLQLAAHTAAINFMHLSFIPAMALGLACTPIVGQWIGRGDIKTAKARAYTATKIGIVIMLTIGIFFAVFGGTLMRVFSADPEVISFGHLLLIFAAVFAGFDAITIVLIGGLRGAGDTRWMMYALTIGSYGVCLPLALLFSGPLGFEAMGAWIGATIYIILLSGFVLRRFHGEKWQHLKIFSEDLETAEARGADPPEELAPDKLTSS